MFVLDVYKESVLRTTFQIDYSTLVNFVMAVAKRYHDHPFRNFRHGFSVIQTTRIAKEHAPAVLTADKAAAKAACCCQLSTCWHLSRARYAMTWIIEA